MEYNHYDGHIGYYGIDLDRRGVWGDMAYLIVSGESLEALTGIVNEKELSGWKATGGPFVVDKKSLWLGRPKKDEGQLVAQALIKIENPCECVSREEPPC